MLFKLTGKKSLIMFVILSFCFLWGYVTNASERIKYTISEPESHPELARMQSIPLEKAENEIRFGSSKRYEKMGVTVVLIKGSPYEMGYSRGILLQNEIRTWIKNCIENLKGRFSRAYTEKTLITRSYDIEPFVPEEFKEELRGLSAGSGIDYRTLLIQNSVDSIGRGLSLECTSVAVMGADGKLLRSRNIEETDIPFFRPQMLIICQPTRGYGFAALSPPGLIVLYTGMNVNGLTLGSHSISASSSFYETGTPGMILWRQTIQYADSIEKAGQIIKDTQRSFQRMLLVTCAEQAAIFEFDNQKTAHIKMEGDHLILTNHTRKLSIGTKTSNSIDRYDEAKSFLDQHRNKMDLKNLIELNRGDYISWAKGGPLKSVHSVIFRPSTLDFWVAIDPPPATRGKWVGFNLSKELYGTGQDPTPQMVPAVK